MAQIRAFVEERGLSAQFIEKPEAREYRETLARREAERTATTDGKRLPDRFAEPLFAAAAAETA